MKILVDNSPKDITEYDLVIDPTGNSGIPKSISMGSRDIPDNKGTLIVINNLDQVSIAAVEGILSSYITKLRLGGEINLTMRNTHEINRNYFLGNINIAQYNQLIYNQISIYSPVAAYTPDFISNILRGQGLTISNIRINREDFTFTIKAIREKQN